MFCPRCGQQAPEEVRFCPRCGLSLTPHAVLMAGAQPAATVPLAQPPPAPTKKRVSTRRAAKMLFFSVVLFPFFLLMSIAADGPGPLFVPFTLFMIGLAWLAYARLFGEDTPHTPRRSRKDLKAGADVPALGAPQFVPASSFNRQGVNTAEISQPPSVTEQTTTLLERDL